MDLKNCEQCGHQFPVDKKFCALCGHPSKAKKNISIIKCSNCGLEQDHHVNFCAGCGSQVGYDLESSKRSNVSPDYGLVRGYLSRMPSFYVFLISLGALLFFFLIIDEPTGLYYLSEIENLEGGATKADYYDSVPIAYGVFFILNLFAVFILTVARILSFISPKKIVHKKQIFTWVILTSIVSIFIHCVWNYAIGDNEQMFLYDLIPWTPFGNEYTLRVGIIHWVIVDTVFCTVATFVTCLLTSVCTDFMAKKR